MLALLALTVYVDIKRLAKQFSLRGSSLPVSAYFLTIKELMLTSASLKAGGEGTIFYAVEWVNEEQASLCR